jgi:hypothetical protein
MKKKLGNLGPVLVGTQLGDFYKECRGLPIYWN